MTDRFEQLTARKERHELFGVIQCGVVIDLVLLHDRPGDGLECCLPIAALPNRKCRFVEPEGVAAMRIVKDRLAIEPLLLQITPPLGRCDFSEARCPNRAC